MNKQVFLLLTIIFSLGTFLLPSCDVCDPENCESPENLELESLEGDSVLFYNWDDVSFATSYSVMFYVNDVLITEQTTTSSSTTLTYPLENEDVVRLEVASNCNSCDPTEPNQSDYTQNIFEFYCCGGSTIVDVGLEIDEGEVCGPSVTCDYVEFTENQATIGSRTFNTSRYNNTTRPRPVYFDRSDICNCPPSITDPALCSSVSTNPKVLSNQSTTTSCP